MRLGIVGRKVGMTQVFDESGGVVPITVIDTSDCYITLKKTKETDGYSALQVSFGKKKAQNLTKPEVGHFKRAGVAGQAWLTEIRIDNDEPIAHLKPGQRLVASMFAKGDRVDVTGTSKGKGFQGVVKRFGFHGADASHGVHEYFRHGGSSGSNTFPGKVLKNKGMPGRTGGTKITVQAMEVFDIKEKDNLIFLRGAVPGPRTGMVVIRSTKRKPLPTGRTLA